MMPVNMTGRLGLYPGIFQGLISPECHEPRPKLFLSRLLLFADPEDRQYVLTNRFHRQALKSRGAGQLSDAETGNRRDSVAADQQRSVDPGEAVDEPGTAEGGGEPGPALDKEPR